MPRHKTNCWLCKPRSKKSINRSCCFWGVRFRCTDQISAMAREQGLDAIDAQYQAEQLSSIQTMAMDAAVRKAFKLA